MEITHPKTATEALEPPLPTSPYLDHVHDPNQLESSPLIIQQPKRFPFYQFIAFFTTAALYSMAHALRTTWGYVKSDLVNSNPYYTSTKLGFLDFAFTISYAIGQYVNGWLGDRLNLKAFLFTGTTCAILGMCLFGYLEGVVYLNNIGIDIVVFILNGLGQSTGYPICICIVSNWFSSGKAGLVFGLWGTNLNIGNIIGQQIGRMTVTDQGHEWQYALFVTSAVLMSTLICLTIFAKVHPKDLTKRKAVQEDPLLGESAMQLQGPTNSRVQQHGRQQKNAIGFLQAWKIKHVPLFALGVFCVKGVTYGVMFWLPYYLKNEAQLEGDISFILAAIELGMIAGSILLGFLSDRIRSRSIIISFGFFFAVIFLILTCVIKGMQLKTLYFTLLFLAGVGIGAPSNLIGGAVSSDLGKELADKESTSATSTVTGIMEGCGALGAAITQVIVSNFTSITFPFFGTLCFLGGTLMLPIAWKDYCRLKRRRQNQSFHSDEV